MEAASMEASRTVAVPAGYILVPVPPGFVRDIGGVYLHDIAPVLGARVTVKHLNTILIAHGGFLATIADTAFGVVMRRSLALPVPPATVTLNVDYLSAVRDGDWLEAHIEVQKVGRQLTNASCLLKVGERLVMRATGVFIMPRQHKG